LPVEPARFGAARFSPGLPRTGRVFCVVAMQSS
jgi:hypothetical protein